jgi:hypothetical protein
MILDPKKFFQDESKSNPMAVAMSYPECPLPEKRPCFWVVTGLGGAPAEICPHFKDESTQETPKAECTFAGGDP